MPVYWFALSQLIFINWKNAFIVFLILHVFVYPSSNGYNSYMDRDTTSIGGLKNPLQPTKQLFYFTVFMDVISLLLSLLIDPVFALGIAFYILASRAYSYRGIRIKKYPVAGYLLVIICQGALIFFLVYHACKIPGTLNIPILPVIASSLLIGGFYPLTQIYQHDADIQDGVKTLSYLLGYKGTFIFTGIVYALAFVLLALTFFMNLDWRQFIILQIFMAPVFVYYFIWFRKVRKDKTQANYINTMRMNILASCCSNLGFIFILIFNQFE